MSNTRKVLYSFIALIALCALALTWIGTRPDFDLEMRREVDSELKVTELSPRLTDIANWKTWHFHLIETVRIDKELSLTFQPRGRKSRRYTLTTKVTEEEPGLSIRFELVKDSKDRLTELFSHLEWEYEIEPRGDHAGVVGTVRAHTANARARILGRLAPKILMNQLLYADLEKLAGQPEAFALPLTPDE